MRQVHGTTLSEVIRRNSGVSNLQADVFFFRAGISGTVFVDGNRDGRFNPGEPVIVNRVVELVDRGTGGVVASARTDRQGGYRFDVRQGLGTGEYLVRVLTPNGATTLTTSRPVTITRGDQNVGAVNLGVRPGQTPARAARPPVRRSVGSVPARAGNGAEGLAEVVNLLGRSERR